MSAPGPGSSESPYASELQQGVRRLRFAPAVEGEFRTEYAPVHLGRMRLGFGMVAAAYLLWLLLRLKPETGAVGDWSLMLRGAGIGAMALAFAASYLRFARPAMPYLILGTYAVLAGTLITLDVLARRHGLPRHPEALMLLSFHAYALSGLLFRPALAAGGIIALACLVGGWIGGDARTLAEPMLALALSQAIGAAALHTLERVERDGFLRRRMLGLIATHDGLTGLFNRVAFFHEFERVVRLAARQGQAIGVVLLDIDYFKAYNDRYGHLEGDACLRAVARAIGDEFRRPLDRVGRYGGEEFIGVWHDIQPQSIRSLADQLRAAVQALRIENTDSPSGRVTASVGAVACVPQEGESLAALIKRADLALYEAKDKGRNRVVIEVLGTPQASRKTGGRRAPSISG